MQINLDSNKLITGAISTVLIGVFTFLWSVNNRVTALEQGKNLPERVEKIESALLPVLVEYKLQQELSKMGYKPGVALPPPPPPTTLPVATIDYLPIDITKESLRNDAENWAKEQIPNVTQQAKEDKW